MRCERKLVSCGKKFDRYAAIASAGVRNGSSADLRHAVEVTVTSVRRVMAISVPVDAVPKEGDDVVLLLMLFARKAVAREMASVQNARETVAVRKVVAVRRQEIAAMVLLRVTAGLGIVRGARQPINRT